MYCFLSDLCPFFCSLSLYLCSYLCLFLYPSLDLCLYPSPYLSPWQHGPFQLPCPSPFETPSPCPSLCLYPYHHLVQLMTVVCNFDLQVVEAETTAPKFLFIMNLQQAYKKCHTLPAHFFPTSGRPRPASTSPHTMHPSQQTRVGQQRHVPVPLPDVQLGPRPPLLYFLSVFQGSAPGLHCLLLCYESSAHVLTSSNHGGTTNLYRGVEWTGAALQGGQGVAHERHVQRWSRPVWKVQVRRSAHAMANDRNDCCSCAFLCLVWAAWIAAYCAIG